MQMYLWNNIFFSLGFDVKDHYKDFGGDAAAYVAPVCICMELITAAVRISSRFFGDKNCQIYWLKLYKIDKLNCGLCGKLIEHRHIIKGQIG